MTCIQSIAPVHLQVCGPLYSSDLSQAILHNHSFKSSSSSTHTLRNLFSQLTGRNYGAHEETAVNSMHLVYSVKVKTAISTTVNFFDKNHFHVCLVFYNSITVFLGFDTP